MKLALIADVHANLHALRAVQAAVGALRPDRVISLGDHVGYNALPNECVSALRAWTDVAVAGNHDRDVTLGDPRLGTAQVARELQRWTRERLEPTHAQWLAALPGKSVEPGEYIAVHGCYLNPEHVDGYVTETMLEANLCAIAGNAEWPTLAFCAHTHVPMIAILDADAIVCPSTSAPTTWSERASAVLINPGSVGQPRDYDPRASFAFVDTKARSVQIHRVAYDIAGAVRAFEGTGLDASLAERLRRGR